MLIKQVDLAKIRKAEITLAFRCWKRPTVKKGGLLTTSIGRLEILDLTQVSQDSITPAEAKEAGYDSLDSLHKALNRRLPGDIYSIKIAYHSPDPRIKLRQQDQLSTEALNQIILGLKQLDNRSSDGPWVQRVMKAIQTNPQLKAGLLAEHTGDEKKWLKLQVRKLKKKGLTISHGIGYSLSPRGLIVLKKLNQQA